MSDVVSGECYRKTVHDLTRELRTAQKLVHQLLLYLFICFGAAIMFAIMWLFEFTVRRASM
jgi:hypothetical protein